MELRLVLFLLYTNYNYFTKNIVKFIVGLAILPFLGINLLVACVHILA